MTILLVEDDDALRAAAHRILKGHGYAVIAAAAPTEALSTFPDLKDTIDLLVTDIVMPEMSGVELARRARQIKPDLKVVFMTGYSAGVFASDGELEGHLIRKPFEQEELIDVIRAAIDAASDVS